ncbi:peroxiredoxin [Paenibacillus sp. PsM32]|uniref:Peroxiredoxin n=1 Tax=Paenibacillus kyungheensis TaxID=1452732 RepID=A0AAX3M5L3_9BACL|nr:MULTISPECIES: peroxiredoxin [Paenibacillus]MDN4616981.1 peroxiredoxin [Paenibacillus sp. PsM32]MDQ1233172.1 peroxiredoxin (alkyl hydroperoxide reductase subunit C) [Paenibacillus sp. SORGH_AS_0306]MDR6110219.1 peroxiredoxin (alkyl hydroperoxide reductase subunit C) [Paenibacillus sp. SORGH_AS_0338]WCT57181.1 peroxiredoxin [Paenibacillus kyungheensis]WDF49718.1 peroxiredoxin [Paenibacillus sp. KACC 21273]
MADRLVGKQAPDFNMETVSGDGKDFGRVQLSDYKGKWLVFFFYPLDFTFVCPTEITALSDAAEEFKALDTEIVGVSTDSIHSHKAWINTAPENNGLGQLNFPLASDITKKVASDYGVLIEEEGVALRGLFIIDPEGELKYEVVNHNDVGRSVEETLRVLQALQSGGLCPMNWKPGQKTLVTS